MRSSSNSLFAAVQSPQVQRSTFDRSHGYKTSFDSGALIPIFCDEVLPGDSIDLKMNTFARLSTPIAPFMDNLNIDYHFFFVPNRLVWDNWQKFCGERENPSDETDFLIPQVRLESGTPSVGAGSIFDYFGIPVNRLAAEGGNMFVNALPFRAYNLIYNEWFRDQNLCDSVEVPKDDGIDSQLKYKLLSRAKRHDYFTSCLPWPQKGNEVSLPLGISAPVVSDYSQPSFKYSGASMSGTLYPMITDNSSSPASLKGQLTGIGSDTTDMYLAWQNPGLVTDLTTATAATINQLREAFQIQRMFERDARGGSRYIEILRSHFGVVSPDARLQRPEFLGSGSSSVNVNPIAQTSSTDGVTPQGNLAAFGVSSGQVSFRKSFVEHGFIIGVASVRSFLTYQQGLERYWSRESRFDFFWPSLAHLGEQAVLNKEIYWTNDSEALKPFGYQERYSEYRYKPSLITGKMRSGTSGSLDIWHLAQNFSAAPALNKAFIEDKPPIDRVSAVPSEPEFIFDSYFSLRSTRCMPVYATPGLIDHF